MQGLLEASDKGVPLFGGGAQLWAGGLSPEWLVDIPAGFSPLPTHQTSPHPGFPKHPRQGDLNVGRGRRCPLPSSPAKLQGWGAWQHVEEGLVVLLTEGCFQDGLNSLLPSRGPQRRPGRVPGGCGSQDFL